ncbi:MAG TPA: zinc dependent phospholipase C family protein [Acidobacteriaceae bacterium]|nr:zinc dependent phospholipase C family protein [Acidobacteriaceae bacterium]
MEKKANGKDNCQIVTGREIACGRAQFGLVYFLVALLVFGLFPQPTDAYSFLTHEDLVDVAWHGSIRPALLARFPNTTAAQLREARSYAYGGATIQDLGYYPFGHQFFSNLTHYVRAGKFVNNLIRDSRTVDEYAFALGALSHYVGDNDGHREATNPSTAIEFPLLGRKYGRIVTYDEAPHAHVRTEFAYDVEQFGRHEFAPVGYMHAIGFKVPHDLVERAFFETYGLSLRSVLGQPRPAFHSYDSAVAKMLPTFAHAEVLIHRKDFPPVDDTPAYQEFSKRQREAAAENGWALYKKKAGFEVHFVAFLIRIVPKIGPISDLAIRGPNAKTNRWYIESVNRSMHDYERMLGEMAKDPQHQLNLPDRDLDTGNLVRPGGYKLTDKTYAELLNKLTADPGRRVPIGLRQDLLAYYSDPSAPISTKKNAHAWKRVQTELTTLQGMRIVGNKVAVAQR